MALVGYKGDLSVGAIFQVTALARADSGDKAAPVLVSARVTRANGGVLAFAFLELDQTAFTLLQEWMAERMRLLNEEATNY